jgi:nitroimidazol reductase NimA-like FMN-containing flavoprotein (pyridoxamine 5'-phosphate oxidase superfamily)
MPSVKQQPLPKLFEAQFAKAGVALKHYQSAESFEKDLMGFLSRNHVLHLSLCKDNVPRSTPLEYRLDGMVFYVLSAGGAKFDYLKKNNKVSFSIAEPYDSEVDYFGYKGLQAWGTAEIISKSNHPEAFDLAFEKLKCGNLLKQLGVTELLPGMNYRFIKLTPDRIKYQNPREGVFRVTWKSD